MKTIRMSREKGEKWLAALRSGEYRQGMKSILHDPEDNAYCCLGVLQHCLSGDVSRHDNGEAMAYPDIGWLQEWGISFHLHGGVLWSRVNPFLSSLKLHAAAANDCGRYTFLQIADAIEEAMEYIDADEGTKP